MELISTAPVRAPNESATATGTHRESVYALENGGGGSGEMVVKRREAGRSFDSTQRERIGQPEAGCCQETNANQTHLLRITRIYSRQCVAPPHMRFPQDMLISCQQKCQLQLETEREGGYAIVVHDCADLALFSCTSSDVEWHKVVLAWL